MRKTPSQSSSLNPNPSPPPSLHPSSHPASHTNNPPISQVPNRIPQPASQPSIPVSQKRKNVSRESTRKERRGTLEARQVILLEKRKRKNHHIVQLPSITTLTTLVSHTDKPIPHYRDPSIQEGETTHIKTKIGRQQGQQTSLASLVLYLRRDPLPKKKRPSTGFLCVWDLGFVSSLRPSYHKPGRD